MKKKIIKLLFRIINRLYPGKMIRIDGIFGVVVSEGIIVATEYKSKQTWEEANLEKFPGRWRLPGILDLADCDRISINKLFIKINKPELTNRVIWTSTGSAPLLCYCWDLFPNHPVFSDFINTTRSENILTVPFLFYDNEEIIR